MTRKATPSSSVGLVREAGRDRTPISSVNGITPTSGPQSRRVPPSSAMITTWKEIIGVKAERRLDIGVARRQDRAGHRR